LKGKIGLSWANLEGEMGEKLQTYFLVEPKELPSIRIIEARPEGTPKKYSPKIHITADNLVKLYGDWKDGKVKEAPREQMPFE